MKRVPSLRAVGSALLGVIVGGLTAFLALGIAGAGHGWCSAAISVLSIVGAPMALIAWSKRDTSGLLLPQIVVAFAVLLDIGLVGLTIEEGVESLKRVVAIIPADLILWSVLFASWQVLGLATLFRALNRRSAE